MVKGLSTDKEFTVPLALFTEVAAERDSLRAQLEAVKQLPDMWLQDCMNSKCTGKCSNLKCANDVRAAIGESDLQSE